MTSIASKYELSQNAIPFCTIFNERETKKAPLLLDMVQWDTIYREKAPLLLGICRRYVRDEQLAEDLMHNAFMTAMEKAETYSGKGHFDGWLRKIVINTALQHLRQGKKMLFAENEPLENQADSQEQTEQEETKKKIIENANFSREELLNIVDELPSHHKIVFNLYVIDGYTHNDIGELLNISPGTSKSHLARARKKIQQLLFEKAQKITNNNFSSQR